MGHSEQPLHIDLQDARMFGQGNVLKMAALQNPGTVEQQAQLPIVLAAELTHGALSRLRIGHIQRRMPGVVQLRGQLGQRLRVDVQQPNLPAVTMKQARRGGTNAGGSSRDQDRTHRQPRWRKKLTTSAMAKSAAFKVPA